MDLQAVMTEVLDPVGVRVNGAQVADDPTALVPLLAQLLAEHGVAVLPGQVLDDPAFLALLRGFGDLTFTVGEAPLEGYPDLNVISNVGRWGTATPPKSSFHVDTSYVSQPPAYTALRAVTVPAQGGATQFTNQFRAAASLPDSLRRRVEGRTITHVGLVTVADAEGVDFGADIIGFTHGSSLERDETRYVRQRIAESRKEKSSKRALLPRGEER